jgi:SnoaL-like domain
VDPVARLIAHDEIRMLAARYSLALDSRDLDTLVDLFVPDVQVGKETGRDALRRQFTEMLRDLRQSILFVAGHVIDLDDDDHAHGVVSTRGELEMRAEREGEMKWIVQAIQYQDTYERRDGLWLFVRRKHLLWYGAELGQSPVGLPPANWPAKTTGTGTLPEAWETWQRFQAD